LLLGVAVKTWEILLPVLEILASCGPSYLSELLLLLLLIVI
jgi:hypothetical protein